LRSNSFYVKLFRGQTFPRSNTFYVSISRLKGQIFSRSNPFKVQFFKVKFNTIGTLSENILAIYTVSKDNNELCFPVASFGRECGSVQRDKVSFGIRVSVIVSRLKVLARTKVIRAGH